MAFPHFKQLDSMDCGPTCLRIICRYYGRNYTLSYLRDKCNIDKAGVSLKGIAEAAESIGLRTLAVKVALKTSKNNIPSLKDVNLPCIVHWNQNHFVVVYKITSSKVYISDPASHKIKLNHEQFNRSYINSSNAGIALLIEKSPLFDEYEYEGNSQRYIGFSFLYKYISPYRSLIIQLLLGLLAATIFQLIFPFLTQSIVDIGIETKNISFIYIILLGQLLIFVGQTTTRFIQSWIILHISVRLNVNLISDYLIKLMNLPISFYDTKNIGDLMQRIGDHKRVEKFLTNSLLNISPNSQV